MALRETHVDIDFHTNSDPLRQVNNEINGILRNTRQMGRAYGKMDDVSRSMLKDMKDGFQQQRDAMMEYRRNLIGAEYGFYMLSKRAKDYHWGTNRMMESIMALGATHKKATDAMMANDDRMKMSIYRTIGVMGNMSTRAEKTKEALNLWQNPIYLASLGSLTLLHNLQKVAQNANPAAIALERLGKNASAKQLNDEIRRLNQGLGALPIAFIIAAAGAGLLYYGMHKLAMQNEEYSSAWSNMWKELRKAIQPMVDVFIMVMVPFYKFITALAHMVVHFNEAHPVLAKIIQGFLLLIPLLTLILLPMGLGIGLVNGYRMAFFALMKMAAPVLTFFATLSPVVWVVAGAIVGLIVAFNYLYNNFAWFRTAVHTVFEWLKAQLFAVINAIKTYFSAVMAVIRGWWAENGQIVAEAVGRIIAVGQKLQWFVPFFKLIWEMCLVVIKTVWSAIQAVIGIAIHAVLNIIKGVMQMINGDWKAGWETIFKTAQIILDRIWQFIKEVFGHIKDFLMNMDLYDIGADMLMGLWNGMKDIGGKALEYVRELGKSIKKVMSKVLDINSPSYEMYKIGSWTVQGQIEGMESQQKHLRQVSYDMASMPMEYTPESAGTSTTTNSSRSLTFSPVIQLNGSTGDSGGVRQQINEALDEAFGRLTTLYDVEVVR